jgi:hypothetical protein
MAAPPDGSAAKPLLGAAARLARRSAETIDFAANH